MNQLYAPVRALLLGVGLLAGVGCVSYSVYGDVPDLTSGVELEQCDSSVELSMYGTGSGYYSVDINGAFTCKDEPPFGFEYHADGVRMVGIPVFGMDQKVNQDGLARRISEAPGGVLECLIEFNPDYGSSNCNDDIDLTVSNP